MSDISMPPIGLLMGKVDLSNLFIDLSGKGYATLAAAKAAGAATINYGQFLSTVTDFLIVAFSILRVVRFMNRFKKAEARATPKTKACRYCGTQISLSASRCPNCTSVLEQQPTLHAAYGD